MCFIIYNVLLIVFFDVKIHIGIEYAEKSFKD